MPEVIDPSSADIGKGRFYLDVSEGRARSRYVVGGRRAIDTAVQILADEGEGQIGIYRNHVGDGFAGYVFKYAGEAPVFEPALT